MSLKSDHALVDKLENVAGITNEDILSSEEIARGRYLLHKAQDMLCQPTLEAIHQSKLPLPDHICRLSVALAPHKRIPKEILERIFCSQSDYDGTVELPPALSSDYPWVLGRVCSRWRHVSRSIPCLWKTTIYFGLYHRLHVHRCEARKQLDCALDILPECADLYCDFKIAAASDVIPTATLISYLSRLTELGWDNDHPEQESLEVLPPGTLSKVMALSVSLTEPKTDLELSTSYAGLFGSSSRLQYLTLQTNTPNFLLSDIPWSQLRKFSLEAAAWEMNAHTWAAWTQIAHSDIFRRMTSLEELIFDMKAEHFPIFLPCEFPWHRLKALIIYWKDGSGEQNFPLILEPLARCTALIYLKLLNFGNPSDPVKRIPIALPSLQYLDADYVHLSGSVVPPSILMSITSSGTLRILKMGPVTLSEFYILMAQCPRLEELRTYVTQDKNKETLVTSTVILPHLNCLELFLDPTSSFPALLVAPHLTFLRVGKMRAERPNLLPTVVTFITRCNIQPHELYFACKEMFDDSQTQVIRNLLSTLNACTVALFCGVIFPDEILDEIAAGVHLPHVRHLGIGVLGETELFKMITSRLEWEEASGAVCLKRIEGYLPREGFFLKNYKPTVELVNERFGVECTVGLLP